MDGSGGLSQRQIRFQRGSITRLVNDKLLAKKSYTRALRGKHRKVFRWTFGKFSAAFRRHIFTRRIYRTL